MLTSISLGKFKSFDTVQKLEDLGRVNIIIGRNNSGKSNFLEFLTENGQENTSDPDEFELAEFEFSPALQSSIKVFLIKKIEEIITAQNLQEGLKEQLRSNLDKFSEPKLDKNKILTEPWNPVLEGFSFADLESIYEHNTFTALHNVRHPTFGASATTDFKYYRHEILSVILKDAATTAQPEYIFKKIDPIESSEAVENELLTQTNIKKPGEAFKKFEKELASEIDGFKVFVPITNAENKNVLGFKTTATDNLEFRALGSGVRQLIKLKWRCLKIEFECKNDIDRLVICIDEPELHLHPTLQKAFIEFICSDKTNAQYLIATHSPSILNFKKTKIYQFQLDDEAHTKVTPTNSATEVFEACTDIGCKASDILQANCIVWVEGPSDIIYLRHWIEKLNPQLQEGVHYSIMFYGGSLLSHVSLSEKVDEEVEKFIRLLPINQNSFVIMDSDQEDSESNLKSRVKRIAKECPNAHWITTGREIENYLNPVIVKQIANDYPQWNLNDVTKFERVNPNEKVRKTILASLYVSMDNGEFHTDELGNDLKSQMKALCDFIKKSNHLT